MASIPGQSHRKYRRGGRPVTERGTTDGIPQYERTGVGGHCSGAIVRKISRYQRGIFALFMVPIEQAFLILVAPQTGAVV